MADQSAQVLEQRVLDEVIGPEGGIGRFRLVRYPSSVSFQVLSDDGGYLDVILEENELYLATLRCLEAWGVRSIDWDDPSREVPDFSAVAAMFSKKD